MISVLLVVVMVGMCVCSCLAGVVWVATEREEFGHSCQLLTIFYVK